MKLFDNHIDAVARCRERKSDIWAKVLFVWTPLCCAVPNVALSVTEPLSVMARIANVLLPLGIYWFLITLTRNVGKATLLMFPLMFLAAFQSVLLKLYGRSVIAVDMFLNLVTTNPAEVGELLGNLTAAIAFVAVVYLTPIIMALVSIAKGWLISDRWRMRQRVLAVVSSLSGLIAMAFSFGAAKAYDPFNDLYPLNAFYNICLAVSRDVQMHNHLASERFTFGASDTHANDGREVYVLVVGETARADNWQLNGYFRNTTPELVGMSGLTSFRRAFSQSNTTHKSVPMLLSSVNAYSFNDSINEVKSILSAFKEAGYHTAFISNQRRNHSYIDFFGGEADTCIFVKEMSEGSEKSGPFYDSDLLPLLDEMLNRNYRRQFIVLHTYGSHFNYADRYPRECAVFKPDHPLEAIEANHEKLINSYDNTILYTSRLLRDIIGRLDDAGICSAMLYTSDHGEDIFDDERNLFLHASPIPSYFQIHVPFIVWMSDSYRSTYPDAARNVVANARKLVSTSDAFFHTALDISGISTRMFEARHSVANALYKESSPVYLNDHNEAVGLSDAGLSESEILKITGM